MRRLFWLGGCTFSVALVTVVACSSSSSESGDGSDAGARSDRLIIDLDAILAEATAGLQFPGACGAAAGVATSFPPIANLCQLGTPSAVTEAGGTFVWFCQGSTLASCTAPSKGDGGSADASGTKFVDGGCGTAAGQMTKTAPTANLCADNSTPSVSGGGALYTWICPVPGSSNLSLCSAPQELTITVNAGAGGTVSPMTKEVGWGSSAHVFTVTPNAGHSANVSGCGGVLIGTQYQTGQITAACTITATFP